MLKIEKFVTPSPEQWEIIIEGMRNPKNSWDRMDSGYGCMQREKWDDVDEGFLLCENCDHTYESKCVCWSEPIFCIGPNDRNLMMTLSNGGPVHAKYRRMIPVWITLTAPLYWWKEFDTYKVGTVANSCSTMHKIQAKEFTLEDFSCEHLQGPGIVNLEATIKLLNYYRDLFNGTIVYERRDGLNGEKIKKDWWWQLIQLLPTSYNQKRTVMLNYEVLHNIYFSRKDHKLDCWHTFCDWIEELPYSELIIGEQN